MNLAQPLWLFGGLFICITLALVLYYLGKRKQAALAKFASHHLVGQLTRNISGRKRRYKLLLLLAAIFFCFAALARPQYGHKWIDVKRKGIDLLFALDTSKSMLAEDMKPNRLKRAHFAILDFVRQLDGDRVGILPFAGSAYLMCPLTIDYDAFEQSLAAVNTGVIPRGGTNIAEVINKAVDILHNDANHKILIILTDGENLEGDVISAAKEAAEKGLTIYTIGLGSSQGELIPLGGGNQGFVKDKDGNFVTSKLDEETLSAIAEKSGGMYAPLGAAGEGLETIYQQKLALIPKEELAEKRHKIPLERFEWPLAAALVLLVLEFSIGERKNSRPVSLFSKVKWKFGRKNKLASLVLLLILSTGAKVYGSTGEKAFAEGDYLKASEYFSKRLEKAPGDPKLNYNYGACAYKNNMFDDAVDAFSKALKSDNIELQQRAYFNKGNSHYQKGAEMLQADPNSTTKQWTQALESLKSAIELAPGDTNARHNRDVIAKRLEELQKQLEQQENEQKQDNQNQQQDQQDKEQSGTGESRQSNAEKEKNKPEQTESDKPQENQDQQPRSDDGDQEEDSENKKQQDTRQNENSGESEQPVPINESQAEEEKEKEQVEKDAIRRQEGKMTKEEAEQLLNALKNEEGELNFIPVGTANDTVSKDW